jgi:hypothetical protein
MMVALLVYAYAVGVRSARGIERRCREDVAFRVITASHVPDHATIARFRARHERAIAELFGGVLELCARAGLVKVGIVAIDGTKIAAAATHHATRSYEQIADAILEKAARIDAAEDELNGEARGDELPEGLRASGDRRKWLREAKQALEAERAAKAKPVPRSRSERLAECKRRLEEDWQLERRVVAEHAAWHGRGLASDGSRGMAGARANIKPYPLTEQPTGRLNVTDPDSRNLKTTRGRAADLRGRFRVCATPSARSERLDRAAQAPAPETGVPADARSTHRSSAAVTLATSRQTTPSATKQSRRYRRCTPGRPRRGSQGEQATPPGVGACFSRAAPAVAATRVARIASERESAAIMGLGHSRPVVSRARESGHTRVLVDPGRPTEVPRRWYEAFNAGDYEASVDETARRDGPGVG